MSEILSGSSDNVEESSDAGFNPFQAPREQSIVEPRLQEDDDFLITPKAILCRETVQLPPVCIHMGLTEGVQPRTRRLRVLSLLGVFQLLMAACLFLLPPLILPSSGILLPQSGLVRLGIFIGLPVLFAFFVWKAVRNDLCAVDATWYVCARYDRQMKLYRWTVRLFLIGGALWAAIEIGSGTLLSNAMLLLIALAVSFLFNPETGLQLVGRKGNGFVLRGHTKRFYETVVHTQNGQWTDRRSTPVTS